MRVKAKIKGKLSLTVKCERCPSVARQAAIDHKNVVPPPPMEIEPKRTLPVGGTVGLAITRALHSLARQYDAVADDLKNGLGCYYMTLEEVLKAMSNGVNTGDNEQALVRFDHNNRHTGGTTVKSRVDTLVADLCVIFIDTVYLAFNNGQWYYVINPNHRLTAALTKYLNGTHEPDELMQEVKVYIVPNDYASDIKRMLDSQTKMKSGDYNRNLAYTGGQYSHQIIAALQNANLCSAPDAQRFGLTSFCNQFNRLAQFLTCYGSTPLTYVSLAHTLRGALDACGRVKATTQNGQLRESVINPITKAMHLYLTLRQILAEQAGTNSIAYKTADKASFMAMYVTAIIGNDKLGKNRLQSVARNIMANPERFAELVSRGSNHGADAITSNYAKLVLLLTR